MIEYVDDDHERRITCDVPGCQALWITRRAALEWYPELLAALDDQARCFEWRLGPEICPEHARAGLVRPLPGGLGIYVQRMIYTTRICVGVIGAISVDDVWCYHEYDDAMAEAMRWDPATEPEPSGWHRHPPSGRRQ